MGHYLLTFLMKFLVVIFFVGVIGSAIVVVITFFEDAKVLIEPDEPAAGREQDSINAAKQGL